MRSVLSNDYPRFDVLIVDDQSTDGTGDIARAIAKSDARVRVIETGALPEGWFGKQWACETGARATKGEIILFADADTTQSSDLITRSVNTMLRRHADLFSVLGRQELGSFWERLVQPQVFSIMSVRYGGTESITKSRFVKDKIANGQCLFVCRSTYEEFGGHALVKSHVADDLMLAQRYFARGKRVVLAEGLNQLSTRMYTSLSELIHGWGKNVFAGGRDSVPLGNVWQDSLSFLFAGGSADWNAAGAGVDRAHLRRVSRVDRLVGCDCAVGASSLVAFRLSAAWRVAGLRRHRSAGCSGGVLHFRRGGAPRAECFVEGAVVCLVVIMYPIVGKFSWRAF